MSSNIQDTRTTATGRTRRCSICGDTTHDRRFHTIAERARQVNIINANRENRRLSQERPRPARPVITRPIPVINTMEDIEYYISNNNIATINNIHQSNKMKDFKTILQIIAHEEKYIVRFINKMKLLYEYKDCLVQYTIQMGAPLNLPFKAYFWRIASFVYIMFNKYNRVNHIDDIIIGEHFMNQPEEWYERSCKSIAKKQYDETIIRLKQQRLEKIILHREETNCDYFNEIECPICYENIPKLNTIETCCNHNFCKNCFTKFVMNTKLDKSLDCPMCRTDIAKVYDIAIVYYSI